LLSNWISSCSTAPADLPIAQTQASRKHSTVPSRDHLGPDGTSLEAQTGHAPYVDPSSAQAKPSAVRRFMEEQCRAAPNKGPHKAIAHVKRSSTTPPGHTRSACPKRSGGASSPKAIYRSRGKNESDARTAGTQGPNPNPGRHRPVVAVHRA
jgi:hypothetical protein